MFAWTLIYVISCMILPRDRLGLAAKQEIPLYWSGLMQEWKCVKKPWVYHGEWSPSESPSPKTVGACGPSGFDLGTSRETPFTMIPPLLFHTLSHCFWILGRYNQPDRHTHTFFLRWFYTLYEQKFLNPRPLLSTTYGQGFQLFKKFWHWTLGSCLRFKHVC